STGPNGTQAALFSILSGWSGTAHLSQRARTSAILHILKLDQQAVWIGKVEFRCAFLGAAAVFRPHADVMDERCRSAADAPASLDAVAFERLDDRIRIETGHAHAQMVDASRSRRVRAASAGPTTSEHQELHAADA